jgi:hypothetical protein
MDVSVNPTSIAIWISVGTALLAGLVSMWVAIRPNKAAPGTTVSILFAIALLLIVLNAMAAAFIAAGGMAYVGLLKAALLLTAAFAIAGMVFGLMRSLWNSKAVTTQST